MNDELADKDARWNALALPKEFRDKIAPLCNLLRTLDDPRNRMILPKGIMLWGPPEIDKRRIARAFANETGLSFLAAGIADMRVGLGESGRKVEKLFTRARGQAPCILFIDELDNIMPARGLPNSDDMTDEIVRQWLVEQDGLRQNAEEKIVFLFTATSQPVNVDSAVRLRLLAIEIAGLG